MKGGGAAQEGSVSNIALVLAAAEPQQLRAGTSHSSASNPITRVFHPNCSLGAAAGAKLKQKKALVLPPAPPLEILVDAELAEAPSPRKPQGGAGREGTLRQRLEAADLDERLQHDPLRLHRVRADMLPLLVCLEDAGWSFTCSRATLTWRERPCQPCG